MEAYAAGDAGAFETLFARLAPRVHAFFVRSLGNDAIADDLLQATFMKLHHARRDYRPGAPVRAWLFTIAARVRLDELRQRQRRREDTDPDALDQIVDGAVASGETVLDRAGVAAAVRAAVDALPAPLRVVVHLHRLEELSFDRIAEMLGMTEGAVRQRAFRGYVALRKTLAPLAAEWEEAR